MALTHDFKLTVQERLQRDAAFRGSLLAEAAACLLSGDVETGKSLLRDCVEAIVGFETLGELTKRSPKSLMQVLSTDGDPRAGSLLEIIDCLQEREGLHLQVQAVR